MISAAVTSEGTPLIWSANDWLKLREEHRIVGQLIGVLPNLPNQEAFHGLPMSLLPEETALLLEQNVISLKTFPSLCRCPGEGVLTAFKSHRRKTYTEQVDQMKQERKIAVMTLVDKIIEGRRRKHLGLDTKKKRKKIKSEDCAQATNDISDDKAKLVELLKPIEDSERQVVIDEELSKIPPLSKENTLVQTFTLYPWLRAEDACPYDWSFPSSHEEKTRFLTFKDLWSQGFFITSGHKFGGNFLVYPGDPVKFHSQFVVLCVPHTKPLSVHELVSFGRIGSSVRKTFVLASLPEDSSDIIYQSIKWTGSTSSLTR